MISIFFCPVSTKEKLSDRFINKSCGFFNNIPRIVKGNLYFLAFVFVAKTGFSQQIIAEFPTKSYQFDFQAIPFGDSILLACDELAGENKIRTKRVRWISANGRASDIFCPANVFALESENDKIYHYYREGTELKAYEKSANSTTMVNMPEAIEFKGWTVLASYVDESLFFVLLNKEGNEISIREISGMRVVNTTNYQLPMSIDEFINKNTYIEFYNDPLLDSFKGRARVKIFRNDAGIYLVIDEKHVEPTKKTPNMTHVLRLEKSGTVQHQKFLSAGRSDFGSFLFDGKLFQNRISKEKFSLLVYDLSGKQLMKDSITNEGNDSMKVNARAGYANFQTWDTFDRTLKYAGRCDPIIVVLPNTHGYTIQCGTYYDEKAPGVYGGANPLAAMLTFFITTAIQQVYEPPGVSRYLYYETDLTSGKVLPVETPPSGLLRGKIDEYERKQQVKGESPFESKNYISFDGGIVGIYRLKPKKTIGVTQLVHFK